MLHGKPINVSVSPQERAKRIADGFTFYARLYRCLAIVFALLALACFWLSTIGETSWFYGGAVLLAAVYLWSVSGLGKVGALSYARGETQGRIALLAFLVMIVASLSLFISAASVVALQQTRLPPAVNLAGTSALLVFGIGSYLIEIIYMATEYQA